MFQYHWFDKEAFFEKKVDYSKLADVAGKLGIIKKRKLIWEEHCLECAPPECYKSCPNYLKRKDGKCRLFQYGIHKNTHLKKQLGADVHFRKWGNLMTILYPRVSTFKKESPIFSNLTTPIAHLGIFSLNAKIIRILEYVRRIFYSKIFIWGNIKTDAFVLHLYSHSSFDYQLNLEIFRNENDEYRATYKKSFKITQGENLCILHGHEYGDDTELTNHLIKIYPEDNKEIEVTFFLCDFVKVKQRETLFEPLSEKVKCVVWDLDNTLWEGILIETEDVNQLQLRNNILNIITGLDERGVLQSIASKNNYDATLSVLQELGIEKYFLYPQINWGAKSVSIGKIAVSLNIDVGSFAFIDDSAFERAEVSAAFPNVRIYSEKETHDLLQRDEFKIEVTEESRNRRNMYITEGFRNEIIEQTNGDLLSFLKQCQLEITIFSPKDEDAVKRCFELVQRTNQLNLSGIKYSQEEFFKIICSEERTSIAFSCKDKFGEYGIVAFAQYKIEKETLTFKEFAMSCRVANKFIESAFLNFLFITYSKKNISKFIIKVQKTIKNTLLRNTLREIGLKTVREDENSIEYSFNGNLKNKDIVKINDKR